MTNSNTAIAILAAGDSKRMGTVKQILPFRGKPMIQHVVDAAEQSVAFRVLVILGANQQVIQPQINSTGSVEVIQNGDWEQGLSTSIGATIDLIKPDAYVDSVLFLLGDQPLISTDFINKMIQKHQEHPSSVIATQYENKKGVPALFPKDYFDQLDQLTGDQGAQQLINNATDVISLNYSSLNDIDTPEDYENLLVS